MQLAWLPLLFLLLRPVQAQFTLQDSHTTASLRGIDAPSPDVAWASGTSGTVLRTLDGGANWQPCSMPPGAQKLDFRGVKGFDAQTAVIMSSGKGDLSRVYKTVDGCKTWKLVFTDPDPDGFFDALQRVTEHQMYLLGDPVHGSFAMFLSRDAGDTWFIADDPGLDAAPGDGAFAASNSSLIASGASLFFATGGTNLPAVYSTHAACPPGADPAVPRVCPVAWTRTNVPLAAHAASAGAFSLAARTQTDGSGKIRTTLVAVGGVYDKPLQAEGTAAFSKDSGHTWRAATKPPSGYRSAVVFDSTVQAWLAVGPSGVDVSRDDGDTWQPMQPGPGDTPEAATGWNAIALPYGVGPKGRIAKLRTGSHWLSMLPLPTVRQRISCRAIQADSRSSASQPGSVNAFFPSEQKMDIVSERIDANIPAKLDPPSYPRTTGQRGAPYGSRPERDSWKRVAATLD